MVRSVVYSSFYTKYRESSKDTALSSFFDTSSDCRDIFLRNVTADNSGFKLEQFFTIGIHWLKVYFTVSVLTASTRLFCILAVHIYFFCEGLFVSNLRSTYVCFYFELTEQTVYDDFQVKLTHSGNDCLSCLFISMSFEGRIFFCKFCKCF